MNLILKVALRNLLRHKGKTFVIGLILFIGAFMMIIGNATIAGIRVGTEQNFVQHFMGDISIVSTNQEIGDIISGIPKPMKTISGYTNLREILNSRDDVERFVPLTKGMLFMLNENGDPMWLFVLGVDMQKYLAMFETNIVAIEGGLLKENESGLLVNSAYRDIIYQTTDVWLVSQTDGLVESNLIPEAVSNRQTLAAKDEVVIMGMSDDASGADIRVSIVGVFKFKQLNAMLRSVCFVDIESYRKAAGYVTAADSRVVVSEENTDLLSMESENLDDLFSFDSDGSMFETVPFQQVTSIRVEHPAETAAPVDPDLGAYNVVFVKLKAGVDREEAVLRMNEYFKENQIDAQAMSWRTAAKQIASLTDIAGITLNINVAMIFFIAIIIIMNTLNMAAMERSSEIGMMRAVGARKSFIAKMFAVETSVISFLFGGLGIVVGSLFVLLLSSLKITSTNDFTSLLFGGDYYHPLLGVGTIVSGIIELGFVTALAMLFPIRLAMKITPLDAISRE